MSGRDDELVERVARVLFGSVASMRHYSGPLSFEAFGDDDQEEFRKEARDIIAAIREHAALAALDATPAAAVPRTFEELVEKAGPLQSTVLASPTPPATAVQPVGLREACPLEAAGAVHSDSWGLGYEAGRADEKAAAVAAVAEVRARYPEDVWPDGGESLDCKSARMARLVCDEISKLVSGAADQQKGSGE